VSTPATPVLLLHGQPGGARDWAGVVAALEDQAGVIAPDRPGWNGGSAATDLEGNARAALAALDAAGVGRATVAGHSFGAAVACRLAIDHPERVSGLVLLAPAANRSSLLPLDYVLAAPVGGFVAGASMLAGAGWVLRPGPVRRRIAAQLGLDERHLARTAEAWRRPAAWRAFASEQRWLVDEMPQLEGRLSEIEAPTMIVIGSADPIVPVRSARELASDIPRAELIVLGRAGHLLPQQHAERIAAVIDRRRR
jgi:pimeloyl-ACP methyl ester carboxylesterase